MPVYNGEKFLKDAILSILNQTYRNFELIIINDASTDSTMDVINSFHDKRIKLLINSSNLGVAKSLNKGLKKAKGEYIARCDADDINLEKRFEIQVRFLEHNKDYVLVGSNFEFINSSGKIIKDWDKKINSIFPVQKNLPLSDRDIRRKMLFRNQILHPSTMFRRKAVLKAGCYKEIFNGAEDYELWFRMLKIGKFQNLADCLVQRRWHQNAIATKNHLKIEILALFIRIFNLPSFLNRAID